MKIETLKKRKFKYFLYALVLSVLLLILFDLNGSLAKYKVTESINIAKGTINYSPSDLNVMAIYVEGDNGYESIESMPESGYTLNSEKSYCKVGDTKQDVTIEYSDGAVNFYNITQKGTKCYLYFDVYKIPAKDVIIASKTFSTRTDFSTALSSDTTGILYTAEDDDGTSYYYAGAPTDNYVYFAGYYWRIIRINGDGSIRMIYAGTSALNNGVSSTATQIKKGAYNNNSGSNAYVGYMYGTPNTWKDGGGSTSAEETTIYSSDYYYSTSYTFDTVNGQYSLSGTKSQGAWSSSYIGYYTCKGRYSTLSCSKIYYMSSYVNDSTATAYTYSAVEVPTVTTYQETHANTNNSTIKSFLDSWYTSNLANSSNYIDTNAGFCNDRSLSSGTGIGATYTTYNSQYIQTPSLKCPNITTDLFTLSTSNKGNKALTYPIGLITAHEAIYAGSVDNMMSGNTSYYLYTGQQYWTMTPSYYQEHALVHTVSSGGNIYLGNLVDSSANTGIRPVINLRSDVILTGSGTSTDPYEVS